MKQYYAPYMKSETLPDLLTTTDEVKYFSTVGIDILNYTTDNRSKWLLNGGIEKDWDGYIARLNQLKLDEFVSKMQSVIDRMTK